MSLSFSHVKRLSLYIKRSCKNSFNTNITETRENLTSEGVHSRGLLVKIVKLLNREVA